MTLLQLADRIATDADAYRELERMRWGNRPVCAHCASERVTFLNPENGVSRKTRTGAASERRVWQCKECRRQFSATTDTVMHGSKISLRIWLLVIFEMCADKNGISAREVERKYGVCPRSAWHMLHRVRAAMSNSVQEPMEGVIVVDETFIGGSEANKHASERTGATGRGGDKAIVLTLIESHTGRARSRVVPNVNSATLEKALAEQVHMPFSTLYTDEWSGYRRVGRQFLAHETVNHSEDEYVRYLPGRVVTTNRAEGFFSQLKRSIDGTHHHVSREHLHRYLGEFDYRHSTRKMSDDQRMLRTIARIDGVRLVYKALTHSGS
jgi:transposase-like protein